MRLLLRALWLTLPLLTGCATVLDESLAIARLPYQHSDDGRIIVGVTVNGTGPHRFAIDTAASRSVIYQRLLEELDAELLPRNVMVQGMVSSGVFPLVHIDTIGIGATDWRDIDLVVLPGGMSSQMPLDGILGLDFLIDYTVVFSTTRRQISLFDRNALTADAYKGWLSIPLEQRKVGASGRSFYFFELRLGGEKVPAVFDLGAGFNLLNWPAARLIDLSPDFLRDREADEIAGALGAAPDVFHVGIDRFETGPMTWTDETFVIGDLPIFEMLVDAAQPTAIIGSELFLRRDFMIDFARSRVLVNRKAPKP